MKQIIRWTHANGETVEYKTAKELAKALNVARNTAYRYIRQGLRSDNDLRTVGRPPKRHDKPLPQSINKHYLDFIAEMETWESDVIVKAQKERKT
jgi:DNA-binding MurR/RpiR family transcriptional regulator